MYDLSEELASCHQTLLFASNQCVLNEEPKKAVDLLTVAFHQHPEDAELALELSKLLVHGGRYKEALGIIDDAFEHGNTQPALQSLRTDAYLNITGDWSIVQSQQAVGLYLDKVSRPAVSRRLIKAHVYNYVGHPSNLHSAIRKYFSSEQGIGPEKQRFENTRRTGRLRVGVVSPMFSLSPVYFLTIGALKGLAQSFDLVFFSRSFVNDAGTQAFKAIAKDWVTLQFDTAEQIAQKIRDARIDVALDLAGWLDLDVVKAFSLGVARKQYKWVGGQATTFGTSAYDGYLSDVHQTPLASQSFHDEPLINLDSGYVTYTPPSYLPAPKRPSASRIKRIVGVVSHPIKLSDAFFSYLKREIDAYSESGGPPKILRFIGWRYAEPFVQARINERLGPCKAVDIEFFGTKSHLEFLNQVRELDWIVDTFPYSCGLTAVEALALGVPIRTYPGDFACQRHAYSHSRYAGLHDNEILLTINSPFDDIGIKNTGVKLVSSDSHRFDHVAMAGALSHLFV